ncbi:MAG: type II toxin-antitoxin system HicB family antitoxin [Bacteroidota bacterium]
MSKTTAKKKLLSRNNTKQALQRFLKLRYTMVVRPLSKNEGGGWFAEIPLLPGCWADGETPDEAITELNTAKRAWMESMLAHRKPIPVP